MWVTAHPDAFPRKTHILRESDAASAFYPFHMISAGKDVGKHPPGCSLILVVFRGYRSPQPPGYSRSSLRDEKTSFMRKWSYYPTGYHPKILTSRIRSGFSKNLQSSDNIHGSLKCYIGDPALFLTHGATSLGGLVFIQLRVCPRH